jgi:hypothetical protein
MSKTHSAPANGLSTCQKQSVMLTHKTIILTTLNQIATRGKSANPIHANKANKRACKGEVVLSNLSPGLKLKP